MLKKQRTVKVLVVMMTGMMLFATGCADIDNNNNQVRQQNVRDNNRGANIFRDNDNNGNRMNRPFGDVDNDGLNGDRNGLFNANDNGIRNGDNNELDTAAERVEVADRAAEKITNLKGVEQANVLVTRNNAYVAAALDDDQQKMTRDIEDQIAKQVRATNPDIQNVYVSTNPQFVDRINGYVDDVQQGRPVAGFMEQFNEMIARIFPNAR